MAFGKAPDNSLSGNLIRVQLGEKLQVPYTKKALLFIGPETGAIKQQIF